MNDYLEMKGHLGIRKCQITFTCMLPICLPLHNKIIPHFDIFISGTTILTASVNEDVECLWCLSDETFPFQTPLKETQVK